MRGQRLFVRAIEAADTPAVRDFLARHSERPVEIPARGLLGKLVGDLVAVMSISVTASSLRIEDITVAKQLRRKQIGRVMINEALQLAKQFNRPRLEVDDGSPAVAFFRHVGFEQEGSQWVKRVGSS